MGTPRYNTFWPGLFLTDEQRNHPVSLFCTCHLCLNLQMCTCFSIYIFIDLNFRFPLGPESQFVVEFYLIGFLERGTPQK